MKDCYSNLCTSSSMLDKSFQGRKVSRVLQDKYSDSNSYYLRAILRNADSRKCTPLQYQWSSSSLVAQTQDRSVHSTEIFGRAIAAHWGANLEQKYGGNKNQDWSGGLKYKHFPVSLLSRSNKIFPSFDGDDFSNRGLPKNILIP